MTQRVRAVSEKPGTEAALQAFPPTKKQGPFCVWHGLSFGVWLQLLAKRPRIEWRYLPKVASITAVSLINSFESAVERFWFGRRLEQVAIEHPPVFVLGHWRSGTTLLHNLLTLDPQFTYPNLYQVLYSGHFLTTQRWVAPLTRWLLPKTRIVDNMPADWNMTQEDEIALLLTTGMSPYLMLLFQDDRSRYERYFSLSRLSPQELAIWKKSLLLFLKKMTYQHRRQIVLKSPGHTYRIPLLLKMFPGAKFIYIYRDPYAVIRSTLHLRRTLFAENGLAAPRLDGLEEDSFLTYEDCVQTYERTKSLIPAGQLHEVRFEDLEADPLVAMHALYGAIGLDGWDRLEPILRSHLSELAHHKKNHFLMDDADRRKIYQRLKWMFDLYGYPSQ